MKTIIKIELTWNEGFEPSEDSIIEAKEKFFLENQRGFEVDGANVEVYEFDEKTPAEIAQENYLKNLPKSNPNYIQLPDLEEGHEYWVIDYGEPTLTAFDENSSRDTNEFETQQDCIEYIQKNPHVILKASKFLDWFINYKDDLEIIGKNCIEQMRNHGYAEFSVDKLWLEQSEIPWNICEGYSKKQGDVFSYYVKFINDVKIVVEEPQPKAYIYEEFLFYSLATVEKTFPQWNDLEYDLLFEKVKEEYLIFKQSIYNDNSKGLYESIQYYLTNIKR